MKKRIIALILAVVMSALALFSCGEYDYSDAKLDKFVSVSDKAAFLNALQNIKIEDAEEFTADSETRKKELHDIVLRSILNADNADKTEYKEGALDYADALYYCYYAKYTDEDGVEHIFNVPKTSGKIDYIILPANQSYLQFGIKANEDDELISAIEQAFGGVDIKDYVYSLDKNTGTGTTEGNGYNTVEYGNQLLVSFTYTYKSAEGKVVTGKVTNYLCTVPEENNAPAAPGAIADIKTAASIADLQYFDNFLCDLVGEKVGKSLGNDKVIKYPANAGSNQATVSYSNIKVEGVAEGSGKEVSVEYKKADSKKFTNIFGKEISVEGNVTYVVLPTYYKKVDYKDLSKDSSLEAVKANVTAILTVFYGSATIQDLTDENGKTTGEKVGALDIFTSEEYKVTYTVGEGEDEKKETKTFKEIIEEFVTIQKDFETDKKAYDTALEDYEDAKKAYEESKKAFDKFDKELKEKQAALDAIEKAIEDGDEEAKKTAIKKFNELCGTEFDVIKDGETEAKTPYSKDAAQKEVDKADEIVNGEPDNDKSTGLKGALEDAEEALHEACGELYGHSFENDGLNCTICGYLSPEQCAAKGHTGPDADCKCTTCGADFHKDADGDCVCDTEECEVKVHNDTDNDCVCNNEGCTEKVHVDADDDHKCDNCGEDYKAEGHAHKEDSAEKKYLESKKERDDFITEKIFIAKKADDANIDGEDNICYAIADEFEESVYEVLEDTYFDEINEKVMKEVYKLIDQYITVDLDKLPRKAVKEIYKKIYEGHKYDFFNSANSTTNNYYDQYEGDFEAYLMIKTGTSSFKTAKAALKEEAKLYVEDIVKIYKAAEIFNVVYTDEEFERDYENEYDENTALIWEYFYGVEYMTKQDLHIARQADKLFDALFTTNTDADGRVFTVNTDGSIVFSYKMISYSIK